MGDYAFVHDGRAYTPNLSTVAADDVAAHNAAIEAEELAAWRAQPDTVVAYYTFPTEDGRVGREYMRAFSPFVAGASVSTWLGSPLGVITSARVYGHNFGGRMVAITVDANNGARYYGRASWDRGSVIRLHKSATRGRAK